MFKRSLAACFLLLFALSLSAQEKKYTMKYEGFDRYYLVHTPPGFNENHASLPVILALHGGGGSPEQFMKEINLNALADQAGIIVVYPGGVPSFIGNMDTWNAGDCCGRAQKINSDDTGFLAKVIDAVVANYHADAHHVFVTGHSNGAMMAYRLACEIPGKIAAIAPVEGKTFSCTHPVPVPVLAIHGTLDKCVPYNGGDSCGGCFSQVLPIVPKSNDHYFCAPVESSLANLAVAYGCSSQTKVTDTDGPMTCSTWVSCPAHADVTLCRIDGGGHTWQGGTQPIPCQKNPDGTLCKKMNEVLGPDVAVDDTKVIMNFFTAHLN